MAHEIPINITISTEVKRKLDNFCIDNELAYNEFITQALGVLSSERFQRMMAGYQVTSKELIERLIDHYYAVD